MSTKAKAIAPTFVEGFVAETKLAANAKTAIMRGWDAITPEVIVLARASDEARTDALTAHYAAKFS